MKKDDNGKFVLAADAQAMLAKGIRIGDVTTGECEFCDGDAAQGRKVSTDVFYLCDQCTKKL